MKVTNQRTNTVTSFRRSASVSQSGGAQFATLIDGNTARVSQPAQTGPVSALDGLLAVQQVPDSTEKRKRSVRQGNDILDRLEQIRIGLLTGRISGSQLAQLVNTLQREREATEDPKLSSLLDEIDLRARVELAKLGLAP